MEYANVKENRTHKRHQLQLNVMCQKVGQSSAKVYSATSINVSPGGVLLEVASPNIYDGDLLSVEMSVPPTEGLHEYGGKFSSYARVIRVDKNDRYTKQIALEFCQSPRVNY